MKRKVITPSWTAQMEEAFLDADREVDRLTDLFGAALLHIRNLEAGITEPTDASRALEPWLRDETARMWRRSGPR